MEGDATQEVVEDSGAGGKELSAKALANKKKKEKKKAKKAGTTADEDNEGGLEDDDLGDAGADPQEEEEKGGEAGEGEEEGGTQLSAKALANKKKKEKKKAKKAGAAADEDNESGLEDDSLGDAGADPQEEGKGGEAGEGEEEGGTQLSAKALANKKKKEKKKAKKTGAAEEEAEDGEEASASAKAKGKKKGGVTNVAARLALERLQAIKEEEEKARLEQERIKKEEEDEKRREEEKLREEEERKKNRAEQKKLKREQLRKDGKLVSKAEKERRARAEQYRALIQEKGLVPAAAGSAEDLGDPNKKSHAVATKKKKKKPADDAGQSTAPQAPTEEEVKEEEEKAPEEDVAEDESDDDWEKEMEKLQLEKEKEQIAKSQGKDWVKDEESEDDEDDDDDDDDDSESDESDAPPKKPAPKAASKASAAASKSRQHNAKSHEGELRSPICCILGHVDTGKTKLLDKIRCTNVQEGEAGGITQQIGATFFPRDTLYEQSSKVDPMELKVPGLLIIDTPGHESFNNLRARGSGLCDIAILVVDIMHGLEPQTLESIRLLRQRKCPFVIALNKVDRLYQWESTAYGPVKLSLDRQSTSVQQEFDTRSSDSLLQLSEQGLNCEIYWKNDDYRRNVSVIPTSAITGEGIPDLLYLLMKLTQNVMTTSLQPKDELECIVLEVKEIEGLGVTIDAILINGVLHEGDQIVVCGMAGPIVTNIRALLTPQPLKELRVRGEYVHHKVMHAAMGVKLSAYGLEDALSGTPLLVASKDDDIEDLKADVMRDMSTIFQSVDKTGCGVYVMASTLGSLEALLAFLKESNIPVFAVNLGTVNKFDVKKSSIMKEKGHPQYATILAFDVKVDPDGRKEAESLGVNIMVADIIYHLFDQFTQYMENFKNETKKEKSGEAVFPCVLEVLPQFIFNKRDPIVCGVRVQEGILKVGTPICVPEREFLRLGRISCIEQNHKPIDSARKGVEVCVKIIPPIGENQIMYGRHFDCTNKLYSMISRDSIDCLKTHFRDEMTKEDWKCCADMKKIFEIP